MLFSSSIFLFFFLPLVIICYHLLKENYRIYFLLLASLFFYAWGEMGYVLLLVFSSLMDYIIGLIIEKNRGKRTAKVALLVSIVGNLSILVFFKYSDFIVSNINALFGVAIPHMNIHLPLGISFYTFQTMSYTIDVYRGITKPQRNLGYFAAYVTMFPQLVAGPIIRYTDIQEQIYMRIESVEKFVSGAKRFVIGLSKKVIIANTVGYAADSVFANPAIENTAATAWIGIICYAFQIFFDFSGYSDMAIGLAKMFGFDFLENFNYPYISKTLTEFWRRWHISLSMWFRDYVYIPLGGNRTGNVYFNLFIVFVVTGFWHGASFNFIIWGLWHGLFLIIERKFKLSKIQKKSFVPFRYAITMLIVLIGWVFFRVEGLREALTYLGVMFGVVQPENVGFTAWYYINTKTILTLIIAAVVSTPIAKTKFFETIQQHMIWKYVSAVMTILLFFISITFLMSSSYNPFIYFRF